MNHEIDLKKYDIHTDLVLDTIENSSLSIKSDTYNIDDIKVTKVNVDEELELAQKFGIQSIPTLILFKDGAPIDIMVGIQQKESLVEKINNAL